VAYRFPSEAWTLAYKEAVNHNENYKTAGKDWTHGAVAMIIEKQPDLGIAQDVGMVLDVHQGTCRGTNYVLGSLPADATFVITGTYERWKEVVQGKLDPIKAMMQGKLKLKKGHLPTMLRYVEASRQLVESASRVPTEFLQQP